MRIAAPARAIATQRAEPIAAAPAAHGPLVLRIGQLQVESAQPMSSRAIEHGFAEAWLEHARSADWSVVSAEHFAHELQLGAVYGVGARELGRRIALAMIQRARDSRGGAR